MHGDKTQSQRQKALARFERGELQTLVATDVAARGIDVAEITHVINFDLPEDAETYTHRVGRTGRAGASGEAVSFVLADQRGEMRGIAKTLGVLDEYHAGVGHGGDQNGGGGGAHRGSPKRRGRKPQGRSNGGHQGRKHRPGGGSRNGGGGGGRVYSAGKGRHRR